MQTSAGGYLLGGISASGMSGDKTQYSQGNTDFWTIKLDASGNKQFEQRFGGSAADGLKTIISTGNDSYLLGGYTESNISGEVTQSSKGAEIFG